MKWLGVYGWLLMLMAFPARAAETVTIAGDPWCPYNCEESAKQQGFMIDLARDIFEHAGIGVVYKNIPWSRAVKDTRDGSYTAIVGAYKDDAPDFIFPENTMALSNDAFYMKKDNKLDWHYTGLKSLKDVSLGVIQDYSYGKEFDDYIQHYTGDAMKIQFATGDDALAINMRKLLAGRIQVVVEDSRVMEYFLNETHQKGLVKLVGVHAGEPIYIAFSPNNPNSKRYAHLLSEGIKQYQDNGKLKAILATYGVE